MTATFPGGNPTDPGYWEVIFDVIPFPVYVVDCATLTIICANRAMMKRVQVKPGDKCWSTIYQQDGPCTFCRMKEVEKAVRAGAGQLEFEHFNDQDDRWYQLRETIVAWFDGRRAKYSIAVDISALKEVQNALAEAHAELAINNRKLNGALVAEQETTSHQRNFLAMVSHEFRMPLSIIGGAAQLLEIYNAKTPEAADEIGKITRAVHRMSDLIDVCLADERLTSAVAAMRLEEADLSAMLTDLCGEKLQMGGAGRLRSEIEPGIRAVFDPALLRVALSNLIDNALKYSPVDSGPVEVTLAPVGGRLRIAVADRGPGIPPSEAERVFEKFYRSPSVGGTRGAGLGLYIVRQIVERHGGTISVSQRTGGGSHFMVELPCDGAGAA